MLNELALKGVKIIGLNYKDNRQEATRWLNQLGDPYAFSIFDAQGSLGLDLGVYGAPETYLLDAEGIVQYRRVGVLDQRSWQREFAERYQLLVSGDVD
jgi:cytochrome c biogenesis protein CcmG/thiol:disulfide interchange protein DsbE